MNNVHRLVVPARDETRRTPEQPLRQAGTATGEVLILPCVRYERMEGREGAGIRRSHGATVAHQAVPHDLTA